MNTLKPRIASLLQQLNERVFENGAYCGSGSAFGCGRGKHFAVLGPPGSQPKKYGRAPAETGIPQRFRI